MELPQRQVSLPEQKELLRRAAAFAHLGFLSWVGAWVWLIGWAEVAFLLLPGIALGAGGGVVLFWVQHNHEQTCHAPREGWTFADAALRGASYVRLPAMLAYLTAHIGLHHVHHLHPRIPNFRLEEARCALPELAAKTPLSAEDFRNAFRLVFWSPAAGRMVGPERLAAVQD